jgi:hypothetical protein
MLSSLISKFIATLPEDEKANVLIFGSAAIVLNGVDLGRPISDLDVFVSERSFDRLGKKYEQKSKNGADGIVPYLEPCNCVEVLQSFPGVSFESAYRRASVKRESQTLRVGSLVDLIIWKNAQGREKDLSDLDQIAKFLSHNNQ